MKRRTMNRKVMLLTALVAACGLLLLCSGAWAQSTCTVDRLTDLGEGQGLQGDLRFCITQATSGADTITFAVTGTVNLTGPLPDLTVSVNIEGPGADLLTVRRDTGGFYRIFTVGTGATVSISGLTISNGSLGGSGGGGILNSGTLTLSNSVVTANFAFAGGDIFNSGTLEVNNSTISSNSFFLFYVMDGGGIFNSGTLTLNNSAVSANSAWYGGGIYNAGTLTVSNSTVSGNAVPGDDLLTGGGILNTGTLTVSDSTISGNGGDIGGGISNGTIFGDTGTLTVSNSTISNNGAFYGGGIWNTIGTLHMRNTIVAGNLYGGDISGSLASSSHNLIGNTGGVSGLDPTDLLNVDPLLGPLADNGGPTLTHALLPGSPAIDAGDNTDAPEFDQRGFPRIVNGVIDIGAFELQRD